MKKIEQMIINAIQNRENFKSGERDNVTFSIAPFIASSVRLWNHKIASIRYKLNTVVFSDCGYPTQTTMSRLNAAAAAIGLPVTFRIKNGCTVVYKLGKLTEEKEFTCNGWTVKISEHEA